MNKSIIKSVLTLSFFVSSIVNAQQKQTKVSQSINVNKNVNISLNTSYTNIVFDTWNKDVVEIEAYVEGEKLSKDELQKALKDWDVNVDATNSSVTISTKGGNTTSWAYGFDGDENDVELAILKELKFELADIPEINFYLPELPELQMIPKIPELPELPKGMASISFDYEAYQKDGEKYLESYSKKMETTFGKDYQKKMEAWGEKFEKEWSEKYGKQMEAWGERYAKKMEEQALQVDRQRTLVDKQREKQEMARQKLIEAREMQAETREKMAEDRRKIEEERRILVGKLGDKSSNSNVKKTIKIKMPKGAKLKVNVRHGEIEFASNIENLKADLTYTKLTANSINGSNTSINASYSPILVNYWNLGSLNLNYVKSANIGNVKHLVLTSNSSNITIDNLIGNAVINGTIGDLNISKIDDAFTNLNIVLQNSNANISIPKVGYSLQYIGNRSSFKHPKKTSKNAGETFQLGSLESGKSIILNAKYSNVTMQ
jgi:hypothetical protein